MTSTKTALWMAFGLALFGSTAHAREATVPGKLTTTEEQALYGAATLRAAPEAGSQAIGQLTPGARVVVFPETSPEGWWYVEIETPEGEAQAGFVPRNFVRVVEGPFKDVAGDHWAAPALERLRGSGFLTGYDTGYFRGEAPFTRFEMAVILDRYMGRLKEARQRIEARIGNLPMRPGLEGSDAAKVDDVIAKLEAFSKEEAGLRQTIAKLQGEVGEHREAIAKHGTILAGHGDVLQRLESQMAGLGRRSNERESYDVSQDRRIDELARNTSQLNAKLASLGSAPTSTTSPSGKVTSSLAANIVRVKELISRTETLEAKVAALEARDRLANLLMKDGSRRRKVQDLAARVDALGGNEVGM